MDAGSVVVGVVPVVDGGFWQSVDVGEMPVLVVVVVVSMKVFSEVLDGFGSNNVCHQQMMIIFSR